MASSSSYGLNSLLSLSLSDLENIDKDFLQYLAIYAPNIEEKIRYYRQIGSSKLKPQAYSAFIINLAPLLNDFIGDLFKINQEILAQQEKYEQFDVIYEARRKFIQRYAIKRYKQEEIESFDFAKITQQLRDKIGHITQHNLAKHIVRWQANSESYQEEMELAALYSAIMYHNNSNLALFDVPRSIEPDNHIRPHRVERLEREPYLGFDYRDEISESSAAMHAKYCIYCHKTGKDSCSKGFHAINPEKYPKKDLTKEGDGCPLKQKISEMNLLKNAGFNIGALATIIIDNPMVAVTGHRICNDCMKTCIYQKQEPVNVPMIETNILNEVLDLPWGVEIYSLLTKWNPLNIDAPLPKPSSGYNILVTGLGPAGFALSHYLLNDGHNVTAIDGLKISPLPFDLSKPIRNWDDIKKNLSQKKPQGFGGVAEYGITNRWDKNNLTLIRLLLERRKNFRMYGGVRLGSNITSKQAFSFGFDHIALCLGAGKPNYFTDKSYFAKGVRSAADFLMNLQQGAPYMQDSEAKYSNSNLQIRLPAIVIGCGLTAIDSAVELMHYYPEQVRQFASKYARCDKTSLKLNTEERVIAEEYLEHAALFAKANNDAEKIKIIQDLGGVTICYRKNIVESPAYRLNHEEIEHTMAIGVNFMEKVTIDRLDMDQYGSVASASLSNGIIKTVRTILVATGTNNNEFIDISGIEQEDQSKQINSYSDIFKNKQASISHFGDCNQKYTGSVVKALASVKNGYKQISTALKQKAPKLSSGSLPIWDAEAIVQKIEALSDTLTKITIFSPICAKNFQAGQFFRLQNYADSLDLTIEPLAVTATEIDVRAGLLSFIIQNVGRSSQLATKFKNGEKIVLMGPTGHPTPIISNKSVLLVGGGIGSALLLPIAHALKKKGCNVMLISGYRKASDLIYEEQLKQNTDYWLRYFENKFEENSEKIVGEGDYRLGNIITALHEAKNEGLFANITQIYCNGSSEMMESIMMHKNDLFPEMEPGIEIIYSTISPMQCMMKGICGQCIQKVDSKRGYVFSCACQDLKADEIDFHSLKQRLQQNSLQEKLSKKLWT